jgi:hypothetical protein
MIALVSILGTVAALAAILAFTELLDRRSSVRLVRRVATARMQPEMAEQLVSEECARLLRSST